TKSDATASTGGSNASTLFGEVMKQELRMKREAAERDFEAQAEKDRTLMRLEELRFLATSTKDLDDVDAYWIKKQKRLIRNKRKNDLGAEDDEVEDEQHHMPPEDLTYLVIDIVVHDVDSKLLEELESMGFSKKRSIRALHFSDE
nr:UBX domain-containing protein 1 [Tanacetum cinerariifolium]